MKCIHREPTLLNEPNKALCVIQADEEPETLPLDGTNVAGLDSHTKIATGSFLYVVTGEDKKIFIMNETETGWNEYGTAET